MGYLTHDHDQENFGEDNESFFDPSIQNSPLPSMRFKPQNPEEAITALQAYMDVLCLLQLEREGQFNFEFFNIDDVRRRIYDFRNQVESTRQSWMKLRDDLTNATEELRIAHMQIEGNKDKIRMLEEDLEDAQTLAKNAARMISSHEMLRDEVFGPKERPERDY